MSEQTKTRITEQLRDLGVIIARSHFQVGRTRRDDGATIRPVVRRSDRAPQPSETRISHNPEDAPATNAVRSESADGTNDTNDTNDASKPTGTVAPDTTFIPPDTPGDGSTLHGQGRVLTMLTLKDQISQRDLTTILGMSRQAVGELLSKLEQKGYITRRPATQDRRVMMVHLTDEGHAAADHLRRRTHISTDLLDCLTDDELDTLSGYLDRIITHAESRFPQDDLIERRRLMRKAMAEFRNASRLPEDDIQEDA
ncbi:MarR family winged helix-turn-helix transcriptional regulator [Bifidobacterium eulemuris]|uniref:MarR family transcriptional regulator n=1 Tax=Bifidobacterium eulemuris TaxID=1765219 RepID=A0A261GE02_9BIFI|nr:MarR family transcriptional regulator [Bifidobacterium eulemuris]OZG69658.1 MarR family transcriptional regulator [Bifidobacterium eulemuris]QOL32231.1 MarR family transcriptional regulator [Bifidobacterium eulemuris]